MQRFILLFACIIVFIMFALQGFQPKYIMHDVTQSAQQEDKDTSAAPEQAITDIYFNVSVMGVEEATPERLQADFGINPDLYTGLWGKYSDGRFGAADVIIMKPRLGQEQEAREALQSIKLSRMSLFKNYDIYNAYSLAENGTIIERGDYMMLLMIENTEDVLAIIENYIPR
ncbi:MAG: DUF4358 domain-containing protein [Angelakisella sp.]